MDLRVYPGSRIAALPRPLQGPAVLWRNLARVVSRPRWSFRADGLATIHLSPFIHDPEWQALYDRMVSDWWQGGRPIDIRWRMWLLTEHARHAHHLEGSFAEFGVYRGGCALMILSTIDSPNYHLFDTFAGIPHSELTARETAEGMGGRLADTSLTYVKELLKEWEDRTVYHEGDIFDVLPTVETGPLSFVHMDLNAASPTARALDYVYPRLVSGGVVVFDDYGEQPYQDQRDMIDQFFSDKPEKPIALPTGQAVVWRLSTS